MLARADKLEAAVNAHARYSFVHIECLPMRCGAGAREAFENDAMRNAARLVLSSMYCIIRQHCTTSEDIWNMDETGPQVG
jgi:hypothetical protein